jgi:penicillin amidase
MKWTKRIIILVAILLAAVILISGVYINSLKPDYAENKKMPGLSAEVEVYYDEFGIPHIYAKSKSDAFEAMGYVHAKERLWQMELLRRIGSGRLSEIFGDRTLETDRFFRTLSIHQKSLEAVDFHEKHIREDVRTYVDAYLTGVNEYIENGDTPVEYAILGIEKTPYTLENIYDVMGYMAFSFAMAHKTEPVMSYLLEKFGDEYLNDLDVHVNPETTMIRSGNSANANAQLSLHVDDLIESLVAPTFIGSNSWVIGPEKTESGSVLFANDPHMGFAQPAVWYEAHLNAPDLQVYGNFVGGMPFPYLGHTDHHAIGLTMYENDDIDLFRETLHPDDANKYLYNGEWLSMARREEVIKVKGGEDVTISVRSTVHGPVLSGVTRGFTDDEVVSMWWIYDKFPIYGLEATYDLLSARSMSEAREAASKIHAPGLNIMYGDVDGNIAWWAAAKLPKRPSHVNSKLILDGSGSDDPEGYFEFSENPQAENPPWGYVYSANNQSVNDPDLLHPGYYLPEDRARRIVSLLEQDKKWTVDDVKSMLLDTRSENAPEIAGLIVAQVKRDGLSETAQECLDIITDWEGDFAANETVPAIYNKVLYKILEYGMKDELEEYFDMFNGTHVMKRSIQPLLANSTSVWWDNIHTEEKESLEDISQQAFSDGIKELVIQLGDDPENWKWGNVHTLEHGHSLGANTTLRPYFNVGPFEVGGNTEVINNLQFRLNPDGRYAISSGPSCRRIVDFSDIEKNSWSILPTGQSGNPMSPHYKDQAEMYAKGEYRRKLTSEQEIKENFKYKAVLSPR